MIDIHAEGERIANETYKPRAGGYLWTDLVGAIQTGIAEERERNAAHWAALRKRLAGDLDSSAGAYAADLLRYLPALATPEKDA